MLKILAEINVWLSEVYGKAICIENIITIILIWIILMKLQIDNIIGLRSKPGVFSKNRENFPKQEFFDY